MLHLILGPAATGKTGRLYAAIHKRIEIKQPGAILIVPEQYSHAAERELVARCGTSASLYAEVQSFTRLASRVADELGGGAEIPLDEGGRILTMHMALRTVADELRLYGHLSRKPEFLQSLLDTVDELKQCDLTPEALLDTAKNTEGSLSDKLRDLHYILAAYNGVSKRTDPRDALTRLADSITKSSVVESAIFVDAFSDFTAQERQVLRRLLTKGTSLTVALTCSGLNDDNPLFHPAVATAEYLRRIAVDYGHAVETTILEPNQNRPAAFCFVERSLFAENAPEPPAQNNAVELYTAAGQMEECELAAERTLSLTGNAGYRYRDIAVAARGFADYETVAEQVFARHGIPVHVARKTSILEKPILLLLTAALDLLDGGWRFEDMFRYLRTGLAGITQREVDLLEEYVRTWNIYGSRWTRKADWTENPAGLRAEFGEREVAALAKINALRQRVTAPLAALEQAGRAARTAAEQATALYDFLETIRLPHTLETRAARFRESGRDTTAAEYGQIWDILVSALEQAHAILGDTPMDRQEFAALMRLTLSQYSVGAIPQTLDRVQFGELDRTRQRDLKCLIVLGATDTRLPAPASERGILTEPERERLRELGLSLSDSAEERVYREQALIYYAFTAPKERLIVSFPRATAEGVACRKSPVLLRLEKLFGRETEIVVITSGFDTGGTTPPLPGNALSVPVTRQLYGEQLALSASRIETFHSCAFRYFMQYGLCAKPRKRAELDSLIAGDFMHYILENVTRDIQHQGGFHTSAASDWRALTDCYVEEYTRFRLGNMAEKSPRFHYLFRRLRRDTYQVIEDMVEELKRSDFVPLAFELTFGQGDKLPPVMLSRDGIDLTLRGAVDRVDGWQHDGKLYLRVVDYKTGKKALSLSDVWYGMGMQMLLYLFALTRLGREQFGGIPLVPSGVLYAPARDVILSAAKTATSEEIEQARRKALTRSGLILRDSAVIEAMERGEKPEFIPVKFGKDGVPGGDSLVTAEELDRLGRHIDNTLLSLAREMQRGSAAPLPLGGSVKAPCGYCEYRGACHHNIETDGMRYLPSLKQDEVLEKLADAES